jgi:predicted MFS family arabinose efflux permease
LIEHASWHWVFFINIPIAGVVIAISIYHVPESHGSGARTVDWLGALTATLGLAGLVYGFLESETRGWTNPVVLGSLIAGIASVVLFQLIESRSSAPMMPLSLYRSRSFTGANILTFLLYAALGVFFFLFPLNFIQIQGYSTTATGAAALPMILLLFFLSRWSGGLVAHYGARTPLVLGPLIVAAGFLLFAIPGASGNYWAAFFPAFVVLGFGMALTVAPLTTVVMGSAGTEQAGIASGVNNAIARVAGVLAIAVFGIVMLQAFSYKLHATLSGLALENSVQQAVESKATKLGGIDLPQNVDGDTGKLIRTAIAQSFVLGFRVVMAICSALAIASAGVAALSVPRANAWSAERH